MKGRHSIMGPIGGCLANSPCTVLRLVTTKLLLLYRLVSLVQKGLQTSRQPAPIGYLDGPQVVAQYNGTGFVRTCFSGPTSVTKTMWRINHSICCHLSAHHPSFKLLHRPDQILIHVDICHEVSNCASISVKRQRKISQLQKMSVALCRWGALPTAPCLMQTSTQLLCLHLRM